MRPPVVRIGAMAVLMSTIDRLAATRPFFTSDDIHDALSIEVKGNQVGRAAQSMLAERIAKPTGHYLPSKRKSSRGRKIALWQSLRYAGESPLVDKYIVELQGSSQGSLL